MFSGKGYDSVWTYHSVNKLTSVFHVDYFDNVTAKFMVSNRADAQKTDVNLFLQ